MIAHQVHPIEAVDQQMITPPGKVRHRTPVETNPELEQGQTNK